MAPPKTKILYVLMCLHGTTTTSPGNEVRVLHSRVNTVCTDVSTWHHQPSPSYEVRVLHLAPRSAIVSDCNISNLLYRARFPRPEAVMIYELPFVESCAVQIRIGNDELRLDAVGLFVRYHLTYRSMSGRTLIYLEYWVFLLSTATTATAARSGAQR
ncbi:hypothetical protein J6590_020347 [Homalodisca vitripennis]|nr:hypothetical protein J6590_020347 [Homalodisca vitripennis]